MCCISPRRDSVPVAGTKVTRADYTSQMLKQMCQKPYIIGLFTADATFLLRHRVILLAQMRPLEGISHDVPL